MARNDSIRVLQLALRLGLAAKSRIALSVMLIAVAMVVFLIINELSRASSDGLDDAILEESGAQGSYAVGFDTDFAMGWESLTSTVMSTLTPMSSEPMTYAVVSTEIQSECPPFEAIGPIPFVVVHDHRGAQLDLAFGNGLPVETVVCVAGQRLDREAIYMPTDADMHRWGVGLYVSKRYQSAVELTNAEQMSRRFVLVTGDPRSQREEILDRLDTAMGEQAAKQGMTISESTVNVTRLDDGESIRAASEGIKLVYTIIAWGVLLLAGLGLLVSQLIVTRGRMWFFGLSRALGAKPRHIAYLVVTDVAITVFAGVAVAILISSILQSTVSDFARDAFNTDARLLRWDVLPSLALATVSSLVLASAWPAFRAMRKDPLDVLEPKEG